MRSIATALAVAAMLSAACQTRTVVNTGESRPETPTPPPRPTPALNHASLVSAFDYYGTSEGRAAYYFVTPGEQWACAIVPRRMAGCQRSDSPNSALGILGEPDAVTDANGESQTPNAILVDREGDGRFAFLPRAEFILKPGPPRELPFGRTLVAGGFRCNVQEQGGEETEEQGDGQARVSCLNEYDGKGFTFSAEQWTPEYGEIPPGPPPP